MADPVMSIPPPSDGPALHGRIIPVAALTSDERHGMFALFARYFEADRATFDRDLDEKECAVVLTEGEGDSIAGFSTLMRLEPMMGATPITVFFSGDTVMDRAYWGSAELPRLWSRHVFHLADSLPGRDVYWFLISSGFRTYRYLPLFFRDFVPNRNHSTPTETQRLLGEIARAKFGARYDEASGIVRLEHRTPLRRGVSDPGPRELRDPNIRFFLEKNPQSVEGDELACLVRIDRGNLTRAGQRMVNGRQ
ncbi:MAG TPA: hypothetical protein VHL58_13660 [Thermoanaerobaculia bacterium]|nr:hypothetical protein [Thermoanaerobaculia bacterium]